MLSRHRRQLLNNFLHLHHQTGDRFLASAASDAASPPAHAQRLPRASSAARRSSIDTPARLSRRNRSCASHHAARNQRRLARQHAKQIRKLSRAPPPRRRGCETKASHSAADTPSAFPTPNRPHASPSCADTPPAPAEPPATSDRRDFCAGCVLGAHSSRFTSFKICFRHPFHLVSFTALCNALSVFRRHMPASFHARV